MTALLKKHLDEDIIFSDICDVPVLLWSQDNSVTYLFTS